MTATPPPLVPPPRHFRCQWWRTATPAAFAVLMFGLLAYQVPGRAWIAASALCPLLLVCVAMHGGLIISRDGIAWYVLRPAWQYRSIPWHAVHDVRGPRFGFLGPIRLIVEHGRYEPWVWGTPQPDRQIDVEIWPSGYAGGEAIWDAIHQFRPSDD